MGCTPSLNHVYGVYVIFFGAIASGFLATFALRRRKKGLLALAVAYNVAATLSRLGLLSGHQLTMTRSAADTYARLCPGGCDIRCQTSSVWHRWSGTAGLAPLGCAQT